MNVASRELCVELYELASEWVDTDYGWITSTERRDGESWSDGITQFVLVNRLAHSITWQPNLQSAHSAKSRFANIPAYDLGYLLRKLPSDTVIWRNVFRWHIRNEAFDKSASASLPEDAACKLAIELFKQGILPAPTPNTATGEGEK